MSDAEWTQRSYAGGARKDPDARSAYQVDYGRIVHSAAFRRLQGKTQILGLGESDFYRTRLTHSIEVAQIGEGIVAHLARVAGDTPATAWLPSGELIRAVCLIHDLGHPPFGHGGEIALNRNMLDAGGFEGNGQSLRITARLEAYYPGYGMNLTRRTLLGVLKYPVAHDAVVGTYDRKATALGAYKPPKCYLDTEQDVVDWMLDPFDAADRTRLCSTSPPKEGAVPGHRKARFKSLDTSIMDTADDISYGIHDMEDGLALGFINQADFVDTAQRLRADLPVDHWFHNPRIEQELFADTHQRKKWISIFVGKLIGGTEWVARPAFSHPLLHWNVQLNSAQRPVLDAFMDLVYRKVIRNPNVQMADYKGGRVISELFTALYEEGDRLLPEEVRRAGEDVSQARRVCDYVASMTDGYAGKLYQKLFQPNFGSVFDRM